MQCAVSLGTGKRELVLRSPVLIAAGALGYDAWDREAVRWPVVGAFITPSLTWRPIAPTDAPRLARTVAGYVQHTGRANPGLRAALRRFGKTWERLQMPIVVALYGHNAAEFAEMAAYASGDPIVQGLELHLPHDAEDALVEQCVAAAVAESAVPCLVRAPLGTAVPCAVAAERGGADAVVVADAPMARALDEDGATVYGPMHSPALAPLVAQCVYEVAHAMSLPIIARGGIARITDALAMVASGALAVQVDSALYVDPGAIQEIHEGLEREMERAGAAEWEAFALALRAR
ncbi:MAG: beta/alpha barrel domain-containing protein [Anaerolineae bacterium]